ncbi:MAG: hypothetical protein ACLPYS_19795 [Vulcanimicrobiaceae bacterium]
MTINNLDPQPEIQFLFRFRDLVGDTIAEHKAIIAEKGACWWGWWKRPTEDARLDVWNVLSQTATPQTPVTVGLFHSGKDRVYHAQVSSVILPNAEGDVRPLVPAGESDLIPSYYRDSPFSRAWMRLTSIDGADLGFFGACSYAEPPHLPGYADEAALARFRNKVILSATELRAMDTTIWRVRRRRAGDSTAEVYVTSRGLHAAVSAETVSCRSGLILHISDPHFSVGANRNQHVWRLETESTQSRQTMVEAITSKVNPELLPIGLIVVTGDLTFTGCKDEYAEATSPPCQDGMVPAARKT